MAKKCYWLDEPLIIGSHEKPADGSVLVIGSGISGVSCAYWLRHHGFTGVSIVDYELEKAASFRNCGHILTGTVESMQALASIHGKETAKELWQYSLQVCLQIEETIQKLGLNCEYAKSGYLCIAIDKVEDQELRESIKILSELGFNSKYYEAPKVASLGFKVTPNKYSTHYSCVIRTLYFGRNG
ncbi:MAG: FAD-binding oxidoreductase, partial [Oligoflexales bacterium]|nr:FAD-binding oxidoreductase [Oligoflexales bacterium]